MIKFDCVFGYLICVLIGPSVTVGVGLDVAIVQLLIILIFNIPTPCLTVHKCSLWLDVTTYYSIHVI